MKAYTKRQATTLERVVRTMVTAACLCIAVTMNAQAQQKTTDTRREVMLETSEGNIRLRLFDETPKHRDNFLKLVRMHAYDSLLFHRVIKNFMIQAGDPKSKYAQPGEELGEGDYDYTTEAEIRLPQIYHKRGALAAAREGDDVNPEHRSSASQFYIVWGKTFSSADIDKQKERIDSVTGGKVQMSDEMVNTYRKVGGTPHLDGTYTVFGEVEEGLDVVDKIQKEMTDDNDRPVTDVRILKAYVIGDTEKPRPTARKVTRNAAGKPARRVR